ncbi:hypothetical protein C0995_014517 [Termitomyces sp. Mi166|nr:hypothetical protein C0995_014517 [Termitomyces sp. Mi166\
MYLLCLFFLSFALVAAIPSFDGAVRQTTISSLVGPTAAFIEALPLAGRKDSDAQSRAHHLGLNPLEATGYPIQLVAGKKAAGSKDGSWRWRGTMLYYDQGSLGNSGLYYNCRLADGSYGLFMFLKP